MLESESSYKYNGLNFKIKCLDDINTIIWQVYVVLDEEEIECSIPHSIDTYDSSNYTHWHHDLDIVDIDLTPTPIEDARKWIRITFASYTGKGDIDLTPGNYLAPTAKILELEQSLDKHMKDIEKCIASSTKTLAVSHKDKLDHSFDERTVFSREIVQNGITFCVAVNHQSGSRSVRWSIHAMFRGEKREVIEPIYYITTRPTSGRNVDRSFGISDEEMVEKAFCLARKWLEENKEELNWIVNLDDSSCK